MNEESKKYEEYLQSNDWKIIRDNIISRDTLCKICNSALSVEVHHLTYKNIFNEKEEDLIGICRPCHGIQHGLIRSHNYMHGFSSVFNGYEDMVAHEIERLNEKDEEHFPQHYTQKI